MACASCGGGRQLTPNRSQPQPNVNHQSPNRIVINNGSYTGGQVQLKPNESVPKTKRTQV